MPIKVTLVSPRSRAMVKEKSSVSVTSEFEYLNLPPLKSAKKTNTSTDQDNSPRPVVPVQTRVKQAIENFKDLSSSTRRNQSVSTSRLSSKSTLANSRSNSSSIVLNTSSAPLPSPRVPTMANSPPARPPKSSITRGYPNNSISDSVKSDYSLETPTLPINSVRTVSPPSSMYYSPSKVTPTSPPNHLHNKLVSDITCTSSPKKSPPLSNPTGRRDSQFSRFASGLLFPEPAVAENPAYFQPSRTSTQIVTVDIRSQSSCLRTDASPPQRTTTPPQRTATPPPPDPPTSSSMEEDREEFPPPPSYSTLKRLSTYRRSDKESRREIRERMGEEESFGEQIVKDVVNREIVVQEQKLNQTVTGAEPSSPCRDAARGAAGWQKFHGRTTGRSASVQLSKEEADIIRQKRKSTKQSTPSLHCDLEPSSMHSFIDPPSLLSDRYREPSSIQADNYREYPLIQSDIEPSPVHSNLDPTCIRSDKYRECPSFRSDIETPSIHSDIEPSSLHPYMEPLPLEYQDASFTEPVTSPREKDNLPPPLPPKPKPGRVSVMGSPNSDQFIVMDNSALFSANSASSTKLSPTTNATLSRGLGNCHSRSDSGLSSLSSWTNVTKSGCSSVRSSSIVSDCSAKLEELLEEQNKNSTFLSMCSIRLEDLSEEQEKENAENVEVEYDDVCQNSSVQRQLETIRQQKELLIRDIVINEEVGLSLTKRLEAVITVKEQEKVTTFLEELEKVVLLTLSLNTRLSKVEEELSCSGHPDWSSLRLRRDKLIRQLDEAVQLRKMSDRRMVMVERYVTKYLGDQELHSFRGYVSSKEELITAQRACEDLEKNILN